MSLAHYTKTLSVNREEENQRHCGLYLDDHMSPGGLDHGLYLLPVDTQDRPFGRSLSSHSLGSTHWTLSLGRSILSAAGVPH